MTRFAECPALPGIGWRFLIGRSRLVETLGLFVVVRDERPFRGPVGRRGDESVSDAAVQLVAKAWRRELRGDLAQKFLVEAPAICTHRREHPAACELLEYVVDVALVYVDDRRQQTSIDDAAEQRGRLNNEKRVRARSQSREQRFIQRVRHLGGFPRIGGLL